MVFFLPMFLVTGLNTRPYKNWQFAGNRSIYRVHAGCLCRRIHSWPAYHARTGFFVAPPTWVSAGLFMPAGLWTFVVEPINIYQFHPQHYYPESFAIIVLIAVVSTLAATPVSLTMKPLKKSANNQPVATDPLGTGNWTGKLLNIREYGIATGSYCRQSGAIAKKRFLL